jgi:hypothetical protein
VKIIRNRLIEKLRPDAERWQVERGMELLDHLGIANKKVRTKLLDDTCNQKVDKAAPFELRIDNETVADYFHTMRKEYGYANRNG